MTRNKNLGNAGEYYVLAQLAQLGYIAGKTDDGQTLIDVIATDPENLRTVNIQVKATGDERQVPQWLMGTKNEQVFDSLWYVLVALKDPSTMPRFYVFHSSEIGPWLQADHQAWLAGGDGRKDSNMRRFRPSAEDLEQRENLWTRMFA
jgi:hypothetical protein